jgi:hypothetical protein
LRVPVRHLCDVSILPSNAGDTMAVRAGSEEDGGRGIINYLDPDGFGALTITKSVTIDWHHTFAGAWSASMWREMCKAWRKARLFISERLEFE